MILISTIAKIDRTYFHKTGGIAEIAGVVHSDPNDRNDYIEARLKKSLNCKTTIPMKRLIMRCKYDDGEIYDSAKKYLMLRL